MNLKINKTITIALILLLTFSALAIFIPAVNSAVVEIDPNFFIMVSPNPIGVGQQLLVSLQLDKTNPNAVGVAGGEHFSGYTVQITKPDGTIENKGPFEAFATSGAIFFYTPTLVGTYTLQASFPGQWVNTSSTLPPSGTTPYSRSTEYYFKPTTSYVLELTVQEDPIGSPIQDVPLPTDYWTRPIYGENKGWSAVTDNWLMEGYDYRGRRFPGYTAFAPYTSAPNSAHIMWKRPLWFGGIGGGQHGDETYYTGLAYEQPYVPLILNGRIIYSEHPPVRASSSSKFGTRCLDLYTGEEIWFLDDVVIDFAQVLSFDSPNEHGLIAHLWTVSGSASNTTYNIHDGFSGNYLFTITNATGGQTTYGPEGEILNYRITGSGSNRRLLLWNSTKAILDSGAGGLPPPRQFEYYSPVPGVIADGRFGIEFNVSIPDIPGDIKFLNLEEGILMTHGVDPSTFPFVYIEAAFDCWTGQLLWREDITNVHGHYGPTRLPYSPSAIRDGIRVIYDDSKTQLHAYSLSNGNEIWVADVPSNGWTYFDQVIDIAYGQVYIAGYDGHVRGFDAETGELNWDFYEGDAGFETAYGTWPIYAGFTIADEKIFVTNDDHSPDSVLWRGGKLYAIDTNDGHNVWNISGWFRNSVIADGYLTSENSLDGMIYTFGKGPSATTVTASPKVSVHGSTVLIEGTVLDQSPGQPGTACISDESMSGWMEYLHMQKPIPTDVKGVTISLDVIDPNGNYVYIGEATSDRSGAYGMAYTPDVPGLYQVIATFAGSESYGSSFAETFINVEEALQPTQPPEQTPAPPTETYIAGSTIAIIAAIAVVAILLLRKK